MRATPLLTATAIVPATGRQQVLTRVMPVSVYVAPAPLTRLLDVVYVPSTV